jgi:GNAT superfamily N-acetyltransferase
MTSLHVEQAKHMLPEEIDELDADARLGGYGIVAKLKREWDANINRFDCEGERLLVAWSGDRIAGIGGMTQDPIDTSAFRMRRFYVRKSHRRHGLGRQIANQLLAEARLERRQVFVNAGTSDAPAFWEAIGFVADGRDGHTHILALPEQTTERQH